MKPFYKAVTFPAILYGVLTIAILNSVVIALRVFWDEALETATFTTISFAIFIALSSMCFNWLRALEAENDIVNSKIIANVAIDSIIASVCFLLGSGLKFSLVIDKKRTMSGLDLFMEITFIVFLTVSMIISATVIFRITKVYLNKRFDIDL